LVALWVASRGAGPGRNRSIRQRAAGAGQGAGPICGSALPNPWDSLPPYWADEVSYIASHYPAP